MQYFILSEAGKPVYARFPTENLASFTALIQTIISHHLDVEDPLISLVSNHRKHVFLIKKPLYLCAITPDLHSDQDSISESTMSKQLELLNLQIVFNLTNSQLQKLFLNNAKFDLGPLIDGISLQISRLLDSLPLDPTYFMNAFHLTAIPLNHRLKTRIMLSKIDLPAELMFTIVSCNGLVVDCFNSAKLTVSMHPNGKIYVIKICY